MQLWEYMKNNLIVYFKIVNFGVHGLCSNKAIIKKQTNHQSKKSVVKEWTEGISSVAEVESMGRAGSRSCWAEVEVWG